MNTVGSETYIIVNNQLKDSITKWISNGLQYWKGERLDSSIQIDPLLCFNSQKDKMIGAILAKSPPNNAMDGIHYLYGVKIKEKWYFFEGASIYLLRTKYQKSSSMPLSFSKLHELSMNYIFNGYLKQSLWSRLAGSNKYTINDHFFDDLTSVAYCADCKTKEDFDKAYLRWVADNWKHRDTTTYNSDD